MESVDAYKAADVWKDYDIQGLVTHFEIDGIYYNVNVKEEITVEVTKMTYGDTPTVNYTGDITIPSTVTYYGKTYTVNRIEDNVFYDCSGLKRVTLPPTITSIGASAFQNCYQLTSVNLPESLIEIGESAFSRCLCLSSMEIPASVTKIGNSAFLQCSSLPAITVSEDNKHYSSVDGVLYNKDVTTLLWFSPMRNGEFTIPETVTYIEEMAFYACALSKVVMPSVVEIGGGAFWNSYTLTSVEFSSSLTNIDGLAFSNCELLNNVVLPASLTTIGSSYAGRGPVFGGCVALTNMVSLNPEPPVADGYFYYSNDCNLSRIYVPKGAVDAYRAAYVWSTLEIVGIDVAGTEDTQVYVASNIEAEEVGSLQEARDEVAFDFALYDDVAVGQGVATLTCKGSDEVIDLPAAQVADASVRGLRVEVADSNDYQVVQPLGDAAQSDGYYTVHFPNGYFLLGTDKLASPAFELSFTVGEVASLSRIDVGNSEANTEYFTLQGVKVVGSPAAGIYIRRQGKKVTKVIIR
jgi:hypothetical protein